MAPHDVWDINPIYRNEFWFDYVRFLVEELGFVAAEGFEESETDVEDISVDSGDEYEREELYDSSDDDDLNENLNSIIESVFGVDGSRSNPLDLTDA